MRGHSWNSSDGKKSGRSGWVLNTLAVRSLFRYESLLMAGCNDFYCIKLLDAVFIFVASNASLLIKVKEMIDRLSAQSLKSLMVDDSS